MVANVSSKSFSSLELAVFDDELDMFSLASFESDVLGSVGNGRIIGSLSERSIAMPIAVVSDMSSPTGKAAIRPSLSAIVNVYAFGCLCSLLSGSFDLVTIRMSGLIVAVKTSNSSRFGS